MKPKNPRLGFFTGIFRVAVGTLVLGSQGLSALQVGAYIAAQYSRRRTVTNNEGLQQPIIEFRTQHTPIVTALAQAYVMQALHQVITRIFSIPTMGAEVRHGVATILKVVTINHAQRSLLDLMERCGAQGLFEMNQLSTMHVSSRICGIGPDTERGLSQKTLQGAAIAEGDSLVLSIRKLLPEPVHLCLISPAFRPRNGNPPQPILHDTLSGQ